MEPRARIALLGDDLADLATELRSLPSGPTVREFRGLFEEAGALGEFQPDAVFASGACCDAEGLGALRMLRAQHPDLGVCLTGHAASEPVLEPMARRLGGRILTKPWLPGQPAAVLRHLLCGSDRPAEEVFQDLARGVADEVNNPLLVASGHLQLLEALVDPKDASLRPTLSALREGMDRIRAAVERLRLVNRAASAPQQRRALDLHALAVAAANEAAPGMPVLREPDATAVPVLLDEDVARPALVALASLCREFRDSGASVHWVVSRFPGSARLRVRLAGTAFAHWRLPATFEPWFAARALRGTAHGLALPVVQALTLSHGGEALARRTPDQAVAIDFLLPSPDRT
ncbi:MAG: hypothetical protein RL148_2466 [Planctomycetota bacterium]